MSSCNRAQQKFYHHIVFVCSFNIASFLFFEGILQKKTEKKGDSLPARGITTRAHRSSHFQPKAPCSALLCSLAKGPSLCNIHDEYKRCLLPPELKRGYPKAQGGLLFISLKHTTMLKQGKINSTWCKHLAWWVLKTKKLRPAWLPALLHTVRQGREMHYIYAAKQSHLLKHLHYMLSPRGPAKPIRQPDKLGPTAYNHILPFHYPGPECKVDRYHK